MMVECAKQAKFEENILAFKGKPLEKKLNSVVQRIIEHLMPDSYTQNSIKYCRLGLDEKIKQCYTEIKQTDDTIRKTVAEEKKTNKSYTGDSPVVRNLKNEKQVKEKQLKQLQQLFDQLLDASKQIQEPFSFNCYNLRQFLTRETSEVLTNLLRIVRDKIDKGQLTKQFFDKRIFVINYLTGQPNTETPHKKEIERVLRQNKLRLGYEFWDDDDSGFYYIVF